MTMPNFVDGFPVRQGDLNALSAGINNLSTYTLGAPPPRTYVPQVRLRRVNPLPIPNGQNTPIGWDTVDDNPDSMFTTSQPTQVTVQTPGTYAVTVEFGFTSSAAGFRVIWGTLNGLSTTANSVCTDEQPGMAGITGRGNTLHIATKLSGLTVGSTFFVQAFQNSGGQLTTAVFQPYSSLSMWRIGP